MLNRNETLLPVREELFQNQPRLTISAPTCVPAMEPIEAFLDAWGYRLIGEVATTSQSLVVMAEHRLLGQKRVVKAVSLAEGFCRDADREALIHEARFQACCPHPCIARAYDVRMTDRIGGIAMEFVGGLTLRDLYHGVPCPQPYQAARFIASLASGVDALHGMGVAHCDIKPSNVLADGWTPRLIDFGSAIRFEEQNCPTEFHRLSGTPAAMAPELLDGRAAPGPVTEVYSLGTLLYYCLAGRYPHSGRQPAVLLKRKMREMPPKLDALRSDAIPRLEGVVLRSLSPFPERRPQNARVFAEELLDACASFVSDKE